LNCRSLGYARDDKGRVALPFGVMVVMSNLTELVHSSRNLPLRLKDGKVIGVVDEDPPEEPRRQDPVEPL
jgi:hypothetical protein